MDNTGGSASSGAGTTDTTGTATAAAAAPTEMSEEVRKRSLTYSIGDGCAYSVMVGLGDSYISPFAVFLNATNTQIGLLTAIPQAVGALFQLVGVTLADTVKRRKLVAVSGSTVQALAWIPIALSPFLFGPSAPVALIVFWALYVGFVSLTVPAWNSWMGDLVKPDERGLYFGKRTSLTQVASFIAYVAGGLILQAFADRGHTVAGFCVLFGLAFAARAVSIFCLGRKFEPTYMHAKEDRFTLWDFLSRAPRANFGRFVFYVAIFTFCVHISAPFFAVYMLRELGFTYRQFMVSNGVAVLATLFTLRSWGKVGDKYGNKKALTLAGLLVPIVPILWTLSRNYYYLLFVQAAAGFAWGGFSLSASNFLFDAVTPPKRARCTGYSSLINGMAIFTGAVAGGLIVNSLPNRIGIGDFSVCFASNLQTLFLLSGLLRLATSVVFLRLFQEVKPVESISVHRLLFTTMQIWPPPSVVLRVLAFRDKKKDGDDEQEEK
ncbi:MAG: MFS transporter [Planctomycetota bacterium]|nr:MFS transporter [Planctomycetota bacterium]